jgi:hypothetical protein
MCFTYLQVPPSPQPRQKKGGRGDCSDILLLIPRILYLLMQYAPDKTVKNQSTPFYIPTPVTSRNERPISDFTPTHLCFKVITYEAFYPTRSSFKGRRWKIICTGGLWKPYPRFTNFISKRKTLKRTPTYLLHGAEPFLKS